MKHRRFGFTLVEVSLFLAITGLLFIGIAVGTQNSIWQQRFNDSTQSFAEFLRSVYSQVSNPQSLGDGRSDQAIYGKLIVFGESVGLDGVDLNQNESQRIFVYDVVGDIAETGTGGTKKILTELNANVVVATEYWDEQKTNIREVAPAGVVESYTPRWSASIEFDEEYGNGSFTGSVLIVRHPRSGTINTFVSAKVIEVNRTVRDANLAFSDKGGYGGVENLLTGELDTFYTRAANFCVNPYGVGGQTDLRRNVRIIDNARNASGVEIVGLDDVSENGNKCRKQ